MLVPFSIVYGVAIVAKFQPQSRIPLLYFDIFPAHVETSRPRGLFWKKSTKEMNFIVSWLGKK